MTRDRLNSISHRHSLEDTVVLGLKGNNNKEILEGQQSNFDQENPLLQNLSLSRKPHALPPLRDSSLVSPRPTSRGRLTPDLKTRKRSPRSPRVKTQERLNARQTMSPRYRSHGKSFQNGDQHRNVGMPYTPSGKDELDNNTLKNIVNKQKSSDRDIKQSEDYIQSLVKQNREALKSRFNNFDKLCENLVNQRDELTVSRQANHERLTTPIETTGSFDETRNSSYKATDYMNISHTIMTKLKDGDKNGRQNGMKTNKNIPASTVSLKRRDTYTVIDTKDLQNGSSQHRILESITSETEESYYENGDSDVIILKSPVRVERPKSAKYGRRPPGTSHGRMPLPANTTVTM